MRGKLQFEVPGDWHVKESVTLLHPDGRANVIASIELIPEDWDAARYAEEQRNTLLDQSQFPGLVEISHGESPAFGVPGYARRFEWQPPDGQRVTQLQSYAADNGRGYVATATALAADFAYYEEVFLATIASLRADGLG